MIAAGLKEASERSFTGSFDRRTETVMCSAVALLSIAVGFKIKFLRMGNFLEQGNFSGKHVG